MIDETLPKNFRLLTPSEVAIADCIHAEVVARQVLGRDTELLTVHTTLQYRRDGSTLHRAVLALCSRDEVRSAITIRTDALPGLAATLEGLAKSMALQAAQERRSWRRAS